MLVLLVVIPLIAVGTPFAVKVIWPWVALLAVEVWSSAISSVTMSELPSTGVIVRLVPMSRYSMLVVPMVPPLALTLEFETKDPAKGMFAPLKIVDVRPSCVMIFGVITIEASASCCRAARREPRVTYVSPPWRITSPITPRSKPGPKILTLLGMGGLVGLVAARPL